MKNLIYLIALSILVIAIPGCKKATKAYVNKYQGGYTAGTENQSTIPKSLNTQGLAGTNTQLPSSFFLYQYLPPVGDQGQFGTCIAWSSGYYTKTALEAVAGSYTANQLATASNQMSAKDLFTAIPDASKGANCDGTSYGDALSVIQSRGVATLATVPYTGLSSCSFSTLDPKCGSRCG
jgi:hypothetical protein